MKKDAAVKKERPHTAPRTTSPIRKPKGGGGDPEIEMCSMMKTVRVVMSGAVMSTAGIVHK